ncbi:MAG: PEP-CTERM sorting domain-containing protein [Symplocastrum torsivum CPER-KK1]|jgi:hypothetical protein|uniref:PEP-CTERM sorting domain-containing protein n=1 Tax=Symplocastrum torsivum CPER-KK1 TaxID=450513 RepID=A0A951PN47_9CYAN|nr:PEP-CTERM sorting domain-containing protein [Symplocastrum torsivum CPER-KK1]
MRFHLPIILGLTTTAVFSTQLAVQAETATYQVESGVTSLSIDASALEVLESLGLSFNSANNTVTPASGFDFGFDILPRSSTFLGTDFTFNYDDATSVLSPLSGTIEHVGSLLFDVDTEQLTLFSPLEIGNFSIGFDNGFSIRDTFTTGLPLFDLVVNANPVLEDNKDLQVANVDVLLSQEFADLLTNYEGSELSEQLAGTVVGQAQISANVSKVPEPGSVVAVLVAASSALAFRRRQKAV